MTHDKLGAVKKAILQARITSLAAGFLSHSPLPHLLVIERKETIFYEKSIG